MAEVAAVTLLSKFGDVSDVPNLVAVALRTYGKSKRIALEAAFDLSEDKDALLEQLINADDESTLLLASKIFAGYDSPRKIEMAMKLLKNERDKVRLEGLAIFVSTVAADKVEDLLDYYLEQEAYYYNVVTWLDRCVYSVGRYREHFQRTLLQMLKRV
jgi:spore coat protein CotH